MLTMREINEADAGIEAHAEVFDAIFPGFGDVLRQAWSALRAHYFCDCTGDDHHWSCPLTPIYAQLIDETYPRRWILGVGQLGPSQ